MRISDWSSDVCSSDLESTKFPGQPSTASMTDYSDLIQPDKGQDARTIHLVDKKTYDEWLKGRSARERAHLAAVGFKPDAFVHAILPGDDPEKWSIVTTVDRKSTRLNSSH